MRWPGPWVLVFRVVNQHTDARIAIDLLEDEPGTDTDAGRRL
ncbi:hypothetical protein [Dactylosporangium sp. CA-139066]